MKDKLRKIISLIVILAILISYIMPGTTKAAPKQFTKYLALGDSIAYGYGLSNKDTESYSAIVKSKYNIPDSNFQNMAVSGMTCAEFYQEIQKDNYTQAIKNVDLISVSIGSNEILELATSALSDITGIPANDPAFLEKVQKAFINASVTEKARMLAAIYSFFTSEETKVKIDEGVSSYETNWRNSVNYIKSINPDVTLIATEFYNPYYELSLGSYDLGGFCDEPIRRLNTILHNQSNNEQEYRIAKIYDSFNTTNPRITNVNISLTAFNLDPHPNKTGHSVIATKIMDVLLTIEETKKDITKLTISDIVDQTYTGSEIRPQVTIKDGTKTLTQDIDYTVTYSNNINVGQARVTIIGIGEYEGTVVKTFNIKEKSRINISTLIIENIPDQIYTGIKITPDVTIKDETKTLTKGEDYSLTYSNNINVGTAQITVEGIGNYEGTKNISFNIIPKDISETNISDIPDQIYTGEEIKPNVVIYNGSAKLVENQDYILEYTNNVEGEIATISIRGRENFTGVATKSFKIIRQSTEKTIDINTLTISDIEDKIYTGKLITPEVRILNGDVTLIKDKDYLINYSNNINVGTAEAIISGIGNYSGQVVKSFKIIAKDIKFTNINDIEDQIYTGQEITPKVLIESDAIELQEGTDYTIEYKDNKEIGTASIIITGKGNYTGSVTKTFNIVKDPSQNIEEHDDNNNNKPDENDNNNNDNNNKPDENDNNNNDNNNKPDENDSNSNDDNNKQNNNLNNDSNQNNNKSNSKKESSKRESSNRSTNRRNINSSNKQDNTSANSKIPKAGKGIVLIIAIFALFGKSIFLGIVNLKYKDI